MSAQHKKRWEGIKYMRSIKPEVIAFMASAGMSAADLDKAVGIIGITNKILNENDMAAEKARSVVEFIRSHPTADRFFVAG